MLVYSVCILIYMGGSVYCKYTHMHPEVREVSSSIALSLFVFRHYFSLNMKHIILGGKQAPGICLSLSPILELHTAHATCLTEYGCLGFGLRASCLHNKCAPAANCWFCILKIDLRGLHMPLYLVYCLCCGIGQDLSRVFFSYFYWSMHLANLGLHLNYTDRFISAVYSHMWCLHTETTY